MESPLGEKSKFPALEMSVHLRSPEKPGLRRRKIVQREPFVAIARQEHLPVYATASKWRSTVQKLREFSEYASKISESASEQHPSESLEMLSGNPPNESLVELIHFPGMMDEQHSSKISKTIGGFADVIAEEEEGLLEWDRTHETTEGFGSEQSHQEISEDLPDKDNDNNNSDSSAAKSQNNSEIEELSPAEKSSFEISLSGRGGGEVHLDVPGNSRHILELDTNTNQQSGPSRLGKMRKLASLKWVFVVLNLVVEVCQATLTQEAAQGKMRHQVYLKLSIATSSFCLVMSLVEAVCE